MTGLWCVPNPKPAPSPTSVQALTVPRPISIPQSLSGRMGIRQLGIAPVPKSSLKSFKLIKGNLKPVYRALLVSHNRNHSELCPTFSFYSFYLLVDPGTPSTVGWVPLYWKLWVTNCPFQWSFDDLLASLIPE